MRRLVEFSLRGFPKATNVYVVGDFCCWFPGAYPMRCERDVWKLIIPLYEGEYKYIYVVDGYKWVLDPDNLETGISPYKRRCSILRVGGDLLSVVGAKGDGKIELRGLYHDQTPRFLDVDEQNVYFKFRTLRNDVSKAMIIRKSELGTEVEMEKIWWDKHFDYYEAQAPISDNTKYFFKVVDKDVSAYFSASGHSFDEDLVVEFELNSSFKAFEVPKWAKGAVFYQIFPDRFYNGDINNDPPNVSKWSDKPNRSNFFGGDLKGIIDKLDYIANLGVDVIYLTPIFSSESNHKYDIYDYYSIDPIFGNKGTLRKLVKEAHARDIKVILDGVFHHTADEFWAYQDMLENQHKSQYIDWYFVRNFPTKNSRSLLIKALLKLPLPFKLKLWLRRRFPLPLSPLPVPPTFLPLSLFSSYETLVGLYGMPKLNLLNPEASEYFLKVVEYWIKEADIDGWRLDTAFGIPHEFWKKFRSRTKALKPSAYLLGELLECEVSPWVGAEAFDAVMNYPFRRIILDFFVHESIGVDKFDYRLAELRVKLPRKALFVMYNLLGCHDTPRVLTLAGSNVRKVKLAVLFQMTFPGAPAIYYGDEVGLLGGDDPLCRGTMIWEISEYNLELFNYYKKLIAIRRKHPALVYGDFNVILKDEKKRVYGYKRTYSDDEIIIIMNNGKEKVGIQLLVNFECQFTDLLTDKEFESHDRKIALEIEPKNGLIFFTEFPKLKRTEEWTLRK